MSGEKINVIVSVDCAKLNEYANKWGKTLSEDDLKRALLENLRYFVELKVE